MKLIRCEGDERFRVQCLSCREWHLYNMVFADMDGPAFNAFYCQGCNAHRVVNGDWPYPTKGGPERMK